MYLIEPTETMQNKIILMSCLDNAGSAKAVSKLWMINTTVGYKNLCIPI